MTRTQFDVWRDLHAATFGLTSMNDSSMFDAWFGHFAAAGYTADELIAATRAIALDPEPPKFRADHLAALNQQVRGGRQRQVRRVVPDDSEVGACVDCGDTGTVCDMPHPRYVVAGEWDGTACAVTCHCYAGRRVRDAWEALTPAQQRDRKPPSIGWDEYARKVPNWRALVAWAADVRAKAQAAREAARVGDLGGPIERVIGRAEVTERGERIEGVG